ncbi:MAG: redoxin domain-containing protein [Acidobacteria bacterium]|nr:redoxin domain-containing protein [Acidobacteriota bacterium]
MISRLQALIYFALREPRALPAGSAAPPFEASDQYGKQIRLADFGARRVLLWFFPKANTSG